VLDRVSRDLPGFFLTGGSALGAFHLRHRTSLDLDLFTPDAHEFGIVDTVVAGAAADLGLSAKSLRTATGFRRILFEGDGEQVVVDFVLDLAPAVDPSKDVVGGLRVDTLREIAVNKLCALLGRSETKDLVDLLFIARAGVDPLGLIPLAARKDGGLTPGALAYSLTSVPLDRLPQGLVVPLDGAELREFRDRLAEALSRLAHPGG
jgi:hypothetical protein